ncbi:hypothetical protein Hanom_Chr14g01264091 [Helianthus anomalus]
MSGPTEPMTCSECILIYSLSLSVCGVWHPLSSFKMELLNHYGILFSQVHHLAFLRIVHFKLTCASFPVFQRCRCIVMTLWNMLQADVKGVSFVFDGAGNQATKLVPGSETPLLEGPSPMGSEDSHNSPHVETISSGDDDDLETRLSRQRKFDSAVGVGKHVPEVRNIWLHLWTAPNKKSQPPLNTTSETVPTAVKDSLSKNMKVLCPSASLVSGPTPVSYLKFFSICVLLQVPKTWIKQ